MRAKFQAFTLEKRDQLKSRGIRRITFLLLFQREFPKYYTFRSRTQFMEDRIYRHLEPALAFQLEVNRLKNFELETIPTANHKMHVYLGKGDLRGGIFCLTTLPMYSFVHWSLVHFFLDDTFTFDVPLIAPVITRAAAA